ncbi:DUF262 domain-containing protein [Maribacter sp. ANRC-HE7]|uniref:DUF262 domain-containing protein n=1 Tax=Maribacter aquimaris TaxID=2737171 RepID=A0ABR7V3G3_9FLAO|nr:DUF262 domain-containing protein [Maribacter aquimaris]MBD0778474.1 DUF262 domain-containing protein [Maribacter aquimaris]
MENNDSKVLNLYPIDYPFETLVGRVNAEPPKLILDPDFQRKYKWDKEGWERASRFIESCLMRIPLPACYFAETDDGKQLVIDGVQRITTINKFFKDEFALEGLSTFKELEGKKFSEIGEYQNELESTTIRCIILRKENPKHLIQEIFSRLNQGAVSLSNQEIRHAIYQGKLDGLLSELAKKDIIKDFGIGQNSEREKNSLEGEEQILRFFALQEDLSDYQDKLNKFLDNYMEQNQNPSDKKITELRRLFNSSIERVLNVFGDESFIDINKDRKRQSMVYYDLLMWSFSDKTDEYIESNKEQIRTRFKQLCADVELQRTLSGGLQNKSSILKRRELWAKKLSEIDD